MARVTITVPEDLKREMINRNKTSWSLIARKAFEDALLEKEMKAAEGIDRLRSSSKTPRWSGLGRFENGLTSLSRHRLLIHEYANRMEERMCAVILI